MKFSRRIQDILKNAIHKMMKEKMTQYGAFKIHFLELNEKVINYFLNKRISSSKKIKKTTQTYYMMNF